MSNAPSKPVSFSRPKVGYFSNRPRIDAHIDLRIDGRIDQCIQGHTDQSVDGHIDQFPALD